jgi:ribosomal-protein-alanine N-acetyltransferase
MSEVLRRGPRVHLRLLERADEAEFLRLVRRSRTLHRPWGAFPPATPEAFRKLAAAKPDAACLVICGNEDDAIVGYFGLSQISLGHFRSAYLGYYAFEPYAGQGYMREGLELLLRHAFGSVGLHRVEANIQPENARSVALVRAAGFRKEGLSLRYLKIGGRWRDHERWAITTEDRRAPRRRP